MTIVAGVLMIIGGFIALLAAVGLHKFSSPKELADAGLPPRPPYARFHAAGKASPVAFLVTAVGASLSLGFAGAALLAVAAIAMALTLPVGVYLMFRAVHHTTESTLEVDELAQAKATKTLPD